ncbi:MAG TPA: hypothetical protein VH008_05360 [Pseudonocardia sp.]|jgi:hypothetical protein|nr:hypothetical protein [Pseudonocardia sp.]
MNGLGLICLAVGLWVALSFPPRPGERRDRATVVLGWVLVVVAVVLLGTATLDPPTQA